MDSESSLSINAPYNDISLAAGHDVPDIDGKKRRCQWLPGASVMAHTGDVSIAANEDSVDDVRQSDHPGNLGVELSAVGICAETATTGSCRRTVLEACIDLMVSGLLWVHRRRCLRARISRLRVHCPSSPIVNTFTSPRAKLQGQVRTAPSMQSHPLDVKACAAVMLTSTKMPLAQGVRRF